MKRIVKISFIALAVIGGITVANRRKAMQLQEQERLARVQVVRQQILKKGVPSVFPKGASQTEGWLSVVGWDRVKSGLELSGDQMQTLKKLTYDIIIPREKEHADDYFAFYHAQLREFWVFYEFQKQLYEKMHGTQLNDFYFLRNLNLFVQTDKAIQEWLSKQTYISDQEPYLISQLLSTNVAFPGNLRSGESSAHYYLTSRSISPPLLSQLFFTVIISYLLEKDVTDFQKIAHLTDSQKVSLATSIAKLDNIVQEIATDKYKQGILISIFIPNYLVDSCSYMSGYVGAKRKHGYYLSDNTPSTVLSTLMRDPTMLRHIENLQARLRLTESAFGDPSAGIKIFINHGISDQDFARYRDQVGQIVTQLITSFEGLPKMSSGAISDALQRYKTHEAEYTIRMLEQLASLVKAGDVDANDIDTGEAILFIEKGMAIGSVEILNQVHVLILRLMEINKIGAKELMPLIKQWADDDNEFIRVIAFEALLLLVDTDQVEASQINTLIQKGLKDSYIRVQGTAEMIKRMI